MNVITIITCILSLLEAQLVTSGDNDDLVSNTFTSKRRTPVIAKCERANNETDDYERSQIEISQNGMLIYFCSVTNNIF